MKQNLEKLGFTNISVMPNFKELKILSSKELKKDFQEPYELCTFSRVMKEKGIEDAVTTIVKLNQRYNKIRYCLDIYGQVDVDQKEWFDRLLDKTPNYIRYRGLVLPDESVSVVSKYFALLFPTRYFTEGIPGTILDAYASGVPVLASKWQNFDDIIVDGVSGLGYSILCVQELEKLLDGILANPDQWVALKQNCLDMAKKYESTLAVQILVENM